MEIIWTKKAIESFKELAFYLNSSFGKDIAVSIVGKVTRRATDLLRNPLLGKVYESSNLLKYEFRFFVINKQTKVFILFKVSLFISCWCLMFVRIFEEFMRCYLL